jgi:hypothetical protein
MMDDNQYINQNEENNPAPLNHEPQYANPPEQPQPPQYGQPQQPQYGQPQPPQYGQPQPPQYGQPQQPQYAPPQQQQPYGQPYQPPYAPPEKDKADGKCIASMVLGICSIVFCWVPILGLVAAIIGLVLGISARKNNKSGIGLAGIITSSLGLAACVIYTIVWIVAISAVTTYYNHFWDWGTYY